MKETQPQTFSLEQAIALAKTAHKDQVDKAGNPYIDHPLHVMNTLQGDTARMVGVLHDTIEDSELTFADLKKAGCPESVIEAIALVTHSPEYQGTQEEYEKKITMIAESGNQLAIDVKYADLLHNSDITRIKEPKEKDFKRVAKYEKSMAVLQPFISEYLKEKSRR